MRLRELVNVSMFLSEIKCSTPVGGRLRVVQLMKLHLVNVERYRGLFKLYDSQEMCS